MRIVVYTQRVEVVESYKERRDCADQRIADFIKTCGYLPVPLPNNADLVKEYLSFLNPVGIILTGGNSLVKYGGNAPERDRMDAALIQVAIEKQIPLYGFCRGMQSILDYFGNKLVNVEGHVAKRHRVFGICGTFEVNSYHNQACMKLESEDLITILKTEDGAIEEIHHKDLPIQATMWHPEREKEYAISDINRVKNLFG